MGESISASARIVYETFVSCFGLTRYKNFRSWAELPMHIKLAWANAVIVTQHFYNESRYNNEPVSDESTQDHDNS